MPGRFGIRSGPVGRPGRPGIGLESPDPDELDPDVLPGAEVAAAPTPCVGRWPAAGTAHETEQPADRLGTR